MIVEGQVHGGIAQGIGQALLEGAVYDKDGQLVTGSFMDYCMPRADNLPSFKVDTTVTRCPGNPLGIKGCGEAGAIAAPAAVINAITDAIGTEESGHAGDVASGVVGAAEGQQQPQGGVGETRCTNSNITARRRCGRRRASWPSRRRQSSSPAATR